MQYKALVVDDEIRARRAIVKIIKGNCSNISTIGEAEDVKSGFEAILEQKPDIVFLDIKMPDGTGFDLLKQFPKISFKVIFLTAFDQYAISAFKFSPVDYILKPVDPEILIDSINRAINDINKGSVNIKLDTLLANIERKKKIVLNTHESIFVADIKDIIRCESDQNYTTFFLIDGRKLMVSKIIKEYDEMLSDCGFLRVHQSHLINIDYIDHYEKTEGGYLVMKNHAQIPVSKRKKEYLLSILRG